MRPRFVKISNMFSREEKRALNTAFFKLFNQRMASHHSQGGGGGRWESYRTGVKGLFFRMLTHPKVGLAIDLQFKDPEIRELFYDQFIELGKLLEGAWGEPADYQQSVLLESGVEVSRIAVYLPEAYFYDKEQWSIILSWYEEKLLGLDEFWEMVGDVVKGLAR